MVCSVRNTPKLDSRTDRWNLVRNIEKRIVFKGIVVKVSYEHKTVLLVDIEAEGVKYDHMWVNLANFRGEVTKLRLNQVQTLVGYPTVYERKNSTTSIAFEKAMVYKPLKYTPVRNDIFHLRYYCGMLELLALSIVEALALEKDFVLDEYDTVLDFLESNKSRIGRKRLKQFNDGTLKITLELTNYLRNDLFYAIQLIDILTPFHFFESSVESGFAQSNIELVFREASNWLIMGSSREKLALINKAPKGELLAMLDDCTMDIQIRKLNKLAK